MNASIDTDPKQAATSAALTLAAPLMHHSNETLARLACMLNQEVAWRKDRIWLVSESIQVRNELLK